MEDDLSFSHTIREISTTIHIRTSTIVMPLPCPANTALLFRPLPLVDWAMRAHIPAA